MTDIRVGVVDVAVVYRAGRTWRVLTLRRAKNTRSTGSWESVHGRIKHLEDPSSAAVRELHEETGLTAERLYSLTVHPMYLHMMGGVQLAVTFAAFVNSLAVTLGPEHDAFEWLTFARATARLTWPRDAEALGDMQKLLSRGNAGAVEDVLRVR